MTTTSDEFEIGILHPTLNPMFGDDIEQQILSPLSCLREYGSHWILEFDLPLVNKKDLSVTLDSGNTIIVEAKLKEKYYDLKSEKRNEFRFFKKTVTLPGKINTKKISAKFENGRLTITIPKSLSGNKIKVQ